MQLPTLKSLIGFLMLGAGYCLIHTIDFFTLYGLILFLYEMIIGNFLLGFHYFLSILRFSIPYICFYFLFCLFRIHYQGYHNLKFFGVDLLQYKPQAKFLIFYVKEYNYILIFIWNFLLLLLFYCYELHKDIWIMIMLISFIYLLV